MVGQQRQSDSAQQRITALKLLTPNEEFAIFDAEESSFVQGFVKTVSA
jgi:hypothetical protein